MQSARSGSKSSTLHLAPLIFALLGCGTNPVSTLTVSISGLPAGVDASVTLSGPSLNQVLTASETLELKPGTYTVAAQSVTAAGATYTAAVVGSPVTLAQSSTASASVTYSAATAPTTGELQLDISGLPAGTPASVAISGPSGYSHTAAATELLSALTPGSYQISATSITTPNLVVYTAVVTGSPADVVGGQTAQAAVVYSASAPSTGSLQVTVSGLPASADASITVTGPGSFSQALTASGTLSDLAPGTYLISAASVTSGSLYAPTVTGSPATVTAGETAMATVAYAAAAGGPGAVQIAITGTTDFSHVQIMFPMGAMNVTSLNSTTMLDPGDYSVVARDFTANGVAYSAVITGSPFTVVSNQTSQVSVAYSIPAPTITDVVQVRSPAAQYQVTVDGTNYPTDGTTVLYIDGVAATITNITAIRIDATVPTPHTTGFYDVTVKTAGGTTAASPDLQFEYWKTQIYVLPAGYYANYGHMVYAPDGKMWWVDISGDALDSIDSNGALGQCPLAPGSGPTEVVVGADHNLWYTDYYHKLVGRVTTSCVITQYPMPSNACTTFGIVSGPDGNLWFTENSCTNPAPNMIGKVDLSNSNAITEYPLPTGIGIDGITAGSDGKLWFVENIVPYKLGSIATDGTLGPSYSDGNTIADFLTTGPDGNLWYAANALTSMTVAGVRTGYDAISLNDSQVVSDPTGGVLYADYANLARFDVNKLTKREYVLTGYPLGMALAPDGDIWCVVEPENFSSPGTIVRITP